MNAKLLLKECDTLGISVALRGDRLRIEPVPPDHLTSRLQQHRDEIVHLLRSRPAAPRAIMLEQLRSYVPHLWRPIKVSDGRTGLLWGVHARGVMVSIEPSGVILTLDPGDITLLDDLAPQKTNGA